MDRACARRLFVAVVCLGSIAGAGPVSAVTPGGVVWKATSGDYGSSFAATAVSPDGATVFTTGTSYAGYLTTAYDAATGIEAWSTPWPGPNADGAIDIAVSPDGSTVFVTGLSTGETTDWDYGTAAYDADTGDELWAVRHDRALGMDFASNMAVSPDGSTVVVTGSGAAGPGDDQRWDSVTVAYDASTGAERWSKTYAPATARGGNGSATVITPDGKAIVTGWLNKATSHGGVSIAVTTAYDLLTGQRVWIVKHRGGTGWDSPSAAALSPSGKSLYVVGQTRIDYDNDVDYATIAYRTSTGEERWTSTYNGRDDGYDHPTDVVVGPNGTVFVTGAADLSGDADYLTVAYEPAVGAMLWAKRYDPAGLPDGAAGIVTSADGGVVYVTGASQGSQTGYDWATISYDAVTGAVRWKKRLDGAGHSIDSANRIAAAPDGSAVYVTGHVRGPDNVDAGTTVAYAS